MKAIVLVLLSLLLALSVAAQTRFNPNLKRELDSLYAADQRWRVLLFDPRMSRKTDSLATAFGVRKEALGARIARRMQQTDSANQVRIAAIIKQYGYPGKSLVGVPTNEAAWYIIQHSEGIDQYLPAIKTAARKGELPFFLYAQMLDRQSMRDGKKQRYGTQGMGYSPTNPVTGRRETQPPFIWPIEDAADVNARRKKAGFLTTVEQNAAALGITYRVLTLQDVAGMPKN